MRLAKKARIALAAMYLAAGSSGFAATITNTDGTFNWTGFDWDANGSAFTTGFLASEAGGNVFTLELYSWAVSLKNGALNIAGLDLDPNANGTKDAGTAYEYTIYANLTEKVQSCTADLLSCKFEILTGTFEIWYDTAANAQMTDGTGFRDGVKIIEGTFNPQYSGEFTVAINSAGIGGSGNSTVNGLVTFTDLAYINPSLDTTTAVTTLQLGSATTNDWVAPTSFDGVTPGEGQVVFQADGNQSFTSRVIPEPASLALFGLGLAGAGFVSRRRKSL